MNSRGNKRAVIVVVVALMLAGAAFGGYQLYKAGQRNHWSREEEAARVKKVAAMPKTVIEFTSSRHDFGTITEGEKVEHAFAFRNAGTAPLMIARADVSCGCTVTDIPKGEIAAGGTGSIGVSFDSGGKEGVQMKNIIVHSNGQQEAISIGFTATVVKKK